MSLKAIQLKLNWFNSFSLSLFHLCLCRTIARVVSQVHAFQKHTYAYTPDLELQSYLQARISRMGACDVSLLAADNDANFNQPAAERQTRRIQDTLRRVKASFQWFRGRPDIDAQKGREDEPSLTFSVQKTLIHMVCRHWRKTLESSARLWMWAGWELGDSSLRCCSVYSTRGHPSFDFFLIQSNYSIFYVFSVQDASQAIRCFLKEISVFFPNLLLPTTSKVYFCSQHNH